MGSGASTGSPASISQEDATKLLQLLGYLRSASRPGWEFVPWTDVDEACTVLGLSTADISKLPRKRGGVDLRSLEEWATANALTGSVSDPAGIPLSGVCVESCGCRVVTGANGAFCVPRGSVTLSKEGYTPGCYPSMSGPLLATLRRTGVTVRVDVKLGGEVKDLETGTILYILPGTLARQDGSIFDGEASVSLSVIDPTREDDLATMPGAFKGKTIDGTDTQLATLGAVHVGATDTASGQPLNVADGKEITLSMISRASIDLNVVDEAISLWSFDEKHGCWVQELSTVAADGVELPGPGVVLETPVRVGGTTHQDRGSNCTLLPTDDRSSPKLFWRSPGAIFEWRLCEATGVGEDCGSGDGAACMWAALEQLCAKEGYADLTARVLQAEARARAAAALPFTSGQCRLLLQEVLEGGPVSFESLQLLGLPLLDRIDLRALQVQDGCLERVHHLPGSAAAASVTACLLLEVGAEGAHALLLNLPTGLHNRSDFNNFMKQILPTDHHKESKVVSCGGKKARGKSSGRNRSTERFAAGERIDTGARLSKGMTREALQSLLKDTRALSIRLRKLGWWNCDAPLPRLGLVVGELTDETGCVLADAQVILKPTNYFGWAYGVTDSAGKFAIPVATDSAVVVDVCFKVAKKAPDYSDPVYRAMLCSTFCTLAWSSDGYFERARLKKVLQDADSTGILSADSSLDVLMGGMDTRKTGKIDKEGFMNYICGADVTAVAQDFRSALHELTTGVLQVRLAKGFSTPTIVGESADLGIQKAKPEMF